MQRTCILVEPKPTIPNHDFKRRVDHAFKLRFVSKRGGVLAIVGEFPSYTIFGSNSKLNSGNHFPKRDTLLDVLHLQTLSQIKLAYPQIILERLLEGRILLL
jgi:hypothetical protein